MRPVAFYLTLFSDLTSMKTDNAIIQVTVAKQKNLGFQQ
jgi:hypothetical protein